LFIVCNEFHQNRFKHEDGIHVDQPTKLGTDRGNGIHCYYPSFPRRAYFESKNSWIDYKKAGERDQER
jgi:hypothetical protein